MSKLSSAIRTELSELTHFLSGSEGETAVESLGVKGTPAEDELSSILSSSIAVDNVRGDNGERIKLILNTFASTIPVRTEDLERAIRWNSSYARNGAGIRVFLEFASNHKLALELPKLLSTAIAMDNALCSQTGNSTKAILDFLRKAEKTDKGIIEKTITEEHRLAARNSTMLDWLNDLSKKEGEPEPDSDSDSNRKEGEPGALSFFKNSSSTTTSTTGGRESVFEDLKVVSMSFTSN